ncbi:hypothetical protein AAFF_G00201720 [Aldrovandia affinis]|uniref:Coiled-coil domain-containing protein 167 n=1 Tax=Aldrovandia affinis TaxID=143900 RepID=A0AAD7SWU5_9TELE|nr:hypothetical protein AAFF_G00201720 [Aldrovandia affinis]
MNGRAGYCHSVFRDRVSSAANKLCGLRSLADWIIYAGPVISVIFCTGRRSKMTKPKEKKKEKISVASEIDRVEARKSLCRDSLERAEFRRRREELSEADRQVLEDEMTVMTERIQKYELQLEQLRGENRRNMLLSVALLVISALFYYAYTS